MRGRRHSSQRNLWPDILLLVVFVSLGSVAVAKAPPRPSPRSAASGQRALQKTAGKLVKLRAEVDRLAAQIRLERTQHLLSLRSKESRRSQLRLLLDQERLRWNRLRTQQTLLLTRLKARKKNHTAMRVALKSALNSVKKGILNSLPYRRKERLGLVDRIESRLKAGRIDAEQGIAALWRILEDELRLTRIVERAEVPLVLKKGQLPRLVKVVRIGMVALFVSEGKGRFGRMVRDSKGRWRYLTVSKAANKEQITRLFRNLSRQLREGLYRLPLFAPR